MFNHKNKFAMSITIKNSNPYLVNRIRNYFYNKGVHTMLCNDETEVTGLYTRYGLLGINFQPLKV